MKTYTPEADIDLAIEGDGIRQRTADQPKSPTKSAAKVAKHTARHEGERCAGGDPHEGMADPADGYGM